MELIVDVHGSAGERARHDGAAALRREHPVHPQAWAPAVGRRGGAVDQCSERGAHVVEAHPGDGADADDGCVVQERAGHAVAHVHLLQFAPFLVDGVDLRHGHHAVTQTYEFEDAQVFLALRFPAFGGGHDEHACIHTAHAGEHVAQEAHVARNVDEAHAFTVRQGGVGEAEVDGETAAAFLVPAVGVGARQRLHQRRLAVVDVAGCCYDAHVRSASTRWPSSDGCTVRRSSRVTPSRVRATTGGCKARNVAR